jgi:hypothetical protein
MLETEGDRISLAATVWCDTGALEAAAAEDMQVNDIRAAVDLYQATFLDGLALDNAPDFELWLAAERQLSTI